MANKPKRRLSKKPSAVDYVVESILGGSSELKYFEQRSDARKHAKYMHEQGEDRVRVFRIRYEPVSDRKARK